ncbi:MAG: chemotaxis protein CheA [Spirochaetota bacterium]|nr:chemotaxis protein CheA [Spirochaetota bacterium]
MTDKKYNMDEAINTFFEESKEMLDVMESSLLDLENDVNDEDSIHSIFRAVHTIKGSSAMFGFVDIEGFTHVVENLLDSVRNKKIQIDSEMIPLLLDCRDYISKLIVFFDATRDGILDDNMKDESSVYIRKLNLYLSPESASSSGKKAGGNLTYSSEGDKANEENEVENESWHISLRFGEDVFRNGLDPQSFINYLGEMGKIVKIKTITNSIPSLEEMDAKNSYIGFELSFMGYTTKERIEEVFEFLEDDCQLRILPPKSNIREYVNLINDLPESLMYIGEILAEVGSLTQNELKDVIEIQSKTDEEDKESESKKLFGEIVIEEKMLQKNVVDAALDKQAKSAKLDEKARKSIRVDTDKVDTLINLVGELVISSLSIFQQSEKLQNSELIESVSIMTNLINDIRDASMKIRMVQIGDTFKRFERVVRDLSRSSDKKVELIITGGETELDKTLIEKITDPIMHLIRNSVDHGIGLPNERIELGKPETGHIYLNAYHDTGSIIIEVKDDGNGLNREKIQNKAVERGLIDQEMAEHISDNELFQYIFEPGFSTAEKITNISGRGVGMDVVKKNIELLRGSVVIQSIEGEGTSIRVHLPLTLAIIDGFMVRVGSLTCVLPLGMVIECTEISKEEIEGLDSGNFINLRGEVVPFLRLRNFFGENEEEQHHENIIVVEYARKKVGFVVDKSLGEFQTVIKPLGKIFKNLQWVSGVTILGDGEVALILDVPRLIQYVQVVESKKAV